jgi:hypothetical protein
MCILPNSILQDQCPHNWTRSHDAWIKNLIHIPYLPWSRRNMHMVKFSSTDTSIKNRENLWIIGVKWMYQQYIHVEPTFPFLLPTLVSVVFITGTSSSSPSELLVSLGVAGVTRNKLVDFRCHAPCATWRRPFTLLAWRNRVLQNLSVPWALVAFLMAYKTCSPTVGRMSTTPPLVYSF